ncbi:hypothetical protein FACS1894201_10860 [Bacteroidia bacterium]|nr:hypothetical protein FACS1894201_10860 [Bacteroidia bacterium]
MRNYISIIASIFFLLSSCKRDTLDRTVFVPDPDDPNLPAYTEWGYNSFGAEYERAYFQSSTLTVPCKIVYQAGLLHFSLIGYLRNEGTKTELTFSFPISAINVYQDLLILHNTVIDLSDTVCEVQFKGDTLSPLQGSHLTFKRAQLLRVDGAENRVILSGTFDIDFRVNGRPEFISDGRFDMGINRDFAVATDP